MAIEEGSLEGRGEAYEADPHEAVTDMRIAGLRFVRLLAGIATAVGVVMVAPGLPILVAALAIFALLFVEGIAIERLVQAYSRRRGRPETRSLATIAGSLTKERFLNPYVVGIFLLTLVIPAWVVFGCWLICVIGWFAIQILFDALHRRSS